jgi:hypothetical protein
MDENYFWEFDLYSLDYILRILNIIKYFYLHRNVIISMGVQRINKMPQMYKYSCTESEKFGPFFPEFCKFNI